MIAVDPEALDDAAARSHGCVPRHDRDRPAPAPLRHRRGPGRDRRHLRVCRRLALARPAHAGPDHRPVRAGERAASRLPAQPRQGDVRRGPLHGQRRGRAPLEGGRVRGGTRDAGRGAGGAGRRSALRGRRRRHRAQPRPPLRAAGRRRVAHRHEQHPGLSGAHTRGLLRAAPRGQARSGHRQAGSGAPEGLLRGPSGEREGRRADQGADRDRGLRRQHLLEPQRLPVRRRGRRRPAGALGPRPRPDAGGRGRTGRRERPVRRARRAAGPGPPALAPDRHARPGRRPDRRRDAALAGRPRDGGCRHPDAHGGDAGGRRQLPRRQLRSAGAAGRHRAERRPAAERPVGGLRAIRHPPVRRGQDPECRHRAAIHGAAL